MLRVYLPPLLSRTQYSQFSFLENYVHASRAEIRKIILRFKQAVPSRGIISRYHACITRSQMEDMKLHGGLPSEHTSVQRIFHTIVLRLRVPVNLYVVSDPKVLRVSEYIRVFLSILYYSRNGGTATFLANFAAGKSDSCATHFRSSHWQFDEPADRGRNETLNGMQCRTWRIDNATGYSYIDLAIATSGNISWIRYSANYARSIDYSGGCRGTGDSERHGFWERDHSRPNLEFF